MSFLVILCIDERKKGGRPDLLDFENPIIRENAPSVTLVPVFPEVDIRKQLLEEKTQPDGTLHLFLNSAPLRVLVANIDQNSALKTKTLTQEP